MAPSIPFNPSFNGEQLLLDRTYSGETHTLAPYEIEEPQDVAAAAIGHTLFCTGASTAVELSPAQAHLYTAHEETRLRAHFQSLGY